MAFPDYSTSDITAGVLNAPQLSKEIAAFQAWSVPFEGISRPNTADGDFVVVFEGTPSSSEQDTVGLIVADHVAIPRTNTTQPNVVFIDNEAGIIPLLPQHERLQDVLILARDASQTGLKFFVMNGPVPQPMVGLGPTATLRTTTSVTATVLSGGELVIGSAQLAPTLERTFRFPGADAGSPFAALWNYAGGVLSDVPTGRARLALTLQVNNAEPAAWEIWLQHKSLIP